MIQRPKTPRKPRAALRAAEAGVKSAQSVLAKVLAKSDPKAKKKS